MKTNLILFGMLLFLATTTAQTFKPIDKRIGDFNVNYVNPEFSPEGNIMIWVEVDTSNGLYGKVWQCGLDPNTGDLIPSDGKGFNPFTSNIYGRPADWGVDSTGLYYVGLSQTGKLIFVRPTSPTTGDVTILPTSADVKRRAIYPSQLPGVNKRFITFVLNDNTIGGLNVAANDTFKLKFIDLDSPANEKVIETQSRVYPQAVGFDIVVNRWIKGSHYLTYGYKNGSGETQVKEFNAYMPDSPPIPVTDDSNNKIDGNTILDPQTGNQYLLCGINGSDTAFFYKRTAFGQKFIKYAAIIPPDINLAHPVLNQSNEPFILNGKLYSAFQLNNDGGNFVETTFNQPGEIWLTTIDDTVQKIWLLSKFDSTLNISEPEPFVGNGKAWVYYSAAVINPNTTVLKRQFELRRCETPMNSVTEVQKHVNEVPSAFTLEQNYPNPFNPSTVISYRLPVAGHVSLKVFDILGREVATLVDDYKQAGFYNYQLSTNNLPADRHCHQLSSGVYFYRLTVGNFSETKKLILLK